MTASRRRAGLMLLAAGASLLACGLAASSHPRRVLGSYLFAWLFFLDVSLGSLASLMMYHLAGGSWSAPVRRYLRAALAPLPLLGLLFVPVLIAAFHSFPWSHDMPAQGLGGFRSAYLTPWLFVLRSVIALAAWCVLASLLRNPGRSHATRSVIGLLVYALTLTWSAVDWIASLVPHWSSTILGLVVLSGQGLVALAFATLCATRARANSERPTAQHCGDLGNLLLTFLMTWMYLEYVQFLITWAEDLPREIGWYAARLLSSWKYLTLLVVIGQFAAPFVLLLGRGPKRDTRALGLIALTLVLSHWLYTYWLIVPSLAPDGVSLSWTDIAATAGIGFSWWYVFDRDLRKDASERPAADAAEGQNLQAQHDR